MLCAFVCGNDCGGGANAGGWRKMRLHILSLRARSVMLRSRIVGSECVCVCLCVYGGVNITLA